MISFLAYISIISESLILLIPFIFYWIGILSVAEATIIVCTTLFIFTITCFRKIKFPVVMENDIVSIIIAPEESSSRFANKYIMRACELNSIICDYRYLAIGTPSLVKDTKIELIYDISEDIFWGLPNLYQLLTCAIIYYRVAIYIIKNQNNIKNVILYSSPDLAPHFFRYIGRRKHDKIKFICTGLPNKEVFASAVGKQTKNILQSTHRIILPFSSGLYSDYYKILQQKNLWNSEKILRCQSSFIMDYLYDAKKTHIEHSANKDIICMIGSHKLEINRHIHIADNIIKKFQRTNYSIVFLCINAQAISYLESLFSNYNNVKFILETEYDYSKARIAVCKSGIGLLKPILYGIPTIPFYLPNIRTKIYFYATYLCKKATSKDVNKNYFLLPNLLTKKELFPNTFVGKVNLDSLSDMINSYINHPPDTEILRIELAKNFLEIDSNDNTFESLINNYLKRSKRNLVQIRKKLSSDAEEDFSINPKVTDSNQQIHRSFYDDLLAVSQLFSKSSEEEIKAAFLERKLVLSESAAIFLASRSPLAHL